MAEIPVNTWIINHWQEIVGVITGMAYVILAIRQNPFCWVFGILSAIFFIIVFFRAGIYANMTLQVYYLGISIYGWIHWKKGKNPEPVEKTVSLPVTRITLKLGLLLGGISVLAVYPLYYLLRDVAMSPVPFLDAVTSVFSMTATWMLARKFLENWLVWIGVDGLSVGMYLSRNLYFTSVLYLAYALMAILGHFEWKKNLHKKS